MTISRIGDYGVLWTLPHTLAFSLAIIAAGAIVRTFRSAVITPPSTVIPQ
jgi:hypothetical protein